MAYNDIVQAIADASKDADTLEQVINGEAETQVKSRLGRMIYTLSTISSRINNLTAQAQSEISNLQDAVNTAAAAGAGANGWTDLLIKTKYNRTLQNKLDDFVSIKDFGAIGDGALHTVNEWTIVGSKIYYKDLAAIQAAYPHVTALTDSIDWAAAQKAVNSMPLNVASPGIMSPKGAINGGYIKIPRGRYVFNKKLSLNRGIQLCGESRESSQLFLKTTDGGIEYSDAGRDVPDEITIRDIAIIQDAGITASSGAGIKIIDGVATVQATSFILENILIVGTYYGIQASAGIACAFTNVITTATVNHGIYIPMSAGFTQSTSIAFFNTYTYLSQTGSGVKIEGTAYGATIGVASDSNARYGYELINTIGFKIHGGAEVNTLGGVLLSQCRGTEVFLNVVDNLAGNSNAVTLDQASGTIIGGVHSSGASATGMSVKSIASGTSQTVELALIRTGGWNNPAQRSNAAHNIAFNGLNGFTGGITRQWAWGVTGAHSMYQLYNSGDAEPTVTAGFRSDVAFNISSTMCSAVVAKARTQNTAMTYPVINGLYVPAPEKGTNSTVVRYNGVVIEESTIGSSGNANLLIGTATVPTGNWNIYSPSTRPSYLGGALTIKPSASATPTNNGDMTFELTSDTTLKIKVKGSDGAVRSASLTLS